MLGSTFLKCRCNCFRCEGVDHNTKHVHRLLDWGRVLEAAKIKNWILLEL